MSIMDRLFFSQAQCFENWPLVKKERMITTQRDPSERNSPVHWESKLDYYESFLPLYTMTNTSETPCLRKNKTMDNVHNNSDIY